MNIAEIITNLSNGIDVTTGEVFDIEEYRDDPLIKAAIRKLQNKFSSNKKGPSYRDYEEKYPGCIIIQKEGYFYSAHNDSAVELGEIMGYRTGTDRWGRVSTGSPKVEDIIDTLTKLKRKFIVIEKGVIVHTNEIQNI